MKSASLQYANALADVALAQGAAEPVTQQLIGFGALYAESAELRNFLSSPAVTKEAKHRVIEKLLARVGGSKVVRNFLLVVVDHQRTHVLPEMIAAFQEVIRQRLGITEAQVSSAVELSKTQKAEMESTLERLTGKRVEAKFSLEPGLLGGAVVRVGDTVYDGSLRTRLNDLRARLASE
ncbi:MAG TPA: ATP synthase F1 subunit delta [Candidatus Acidoferrum sp.]|nr:ATP synthase F1 subunit delta [Candidatus Acidoferrum sp.]